MSDSTQSSPQCNLETSISQLSIHSNQSSANANVDDWDQSILVDTGAGPSTPPNGHQNPSSDAETTTTPAAAAAGGDKDKMGTRGKKSLSEMLKRHIEKGRSLNLSDEDEENLSEELGKWINSDSSPYELDDSFFPPEKNDTRSRAGSTVEKKEEEDDSA